MSAEPLVITSALIAKIHKTLDAGLVSGLGIPVPGKFCVEAAICYALGLPHGDHPACVGAAVRAFKIHLNDSSWSSDQARAAGLREIAVAQLGSNTLNQAEFSSRLTIKTVQRLVPMALRAAAEIKGNEKHASALKAAALKCEKVTNRDEARGAAQLARKTAYAAAYAATSAAAYAADADADANATAYADVYAATNAAANAAAYTANALNAATNAAAYAADAAANAAAYAATNSANAARDKILRLMADIGVEVLRELNSPGCEWLEVKEAA